MPSCWNGKVGGRELVPSWVGMAIQAQPASTQPGPTIMGRILPGSIKNRVGYGFKTKNPKRVRVGPDFGKNPTRTRPNPFKLKIKLLKYLHIYIFHL